MCFAAGTEVLTAAGLVPIETIRAGDRVVAYDEVSGQTGEFRVVGTFQRMADWLVLVGIGEETIKATDEHPFWVLGQSWVPARDLRPGMNLMGPDGQFVQVGNISFVREQTLVYNMEIENAHTYFVSRSSVLVHNACQALQRGGHVLENSTLKALDLTPSQGKEAMEAIKKAMGLPSDYHRLTIMGNGDVIMPGGTVIGNLLDGAF